MILFVCPLKKELKELLQALAHYRVCPEPRYLGPRTVYFWGKTHVMAAVRPGAVDFSRFTIQLIDELPELKTLWLLGTAGSLSPQVKVGDLVVNHQSSDLSLSSREGHQNFVVHCGDILTVEDAIADADLARELAQKSQALCVAWESKAAKELCQNRGLRFNEIRTITDHCDAKAFTDFNKNLPDAIKNLAQKLLDWGAFDEE